MKHLFIVNPTAGGSDKTEVVREKALSVLGEGNFEIYVTKSRMDASREVKARGNSGEEYFIYSCGGDGTFSECCDGAKGFSNISVAPFPTGTGNDFCRMFGQEAELYKDLNALIEGKPHPIDVIDCNGRTSVNLCSVGFDARVGCNVHNYTHLPLCKGGLAYVVSLIVELTKGINKEMIITCNGQTMKGEFALACVCNGRYYGGGFNPSLNAMPDDGDLDIYIAKKTGFLKLAANLGTYSSGKSDKIPDSIIHLHSNAISIEFEDEEIINIDGETQYSKIADMKLVPLAVNLIVPKGMKFFNN